MMLTCPVCGTALSSDGEWFTCPYSTRSDLAYKPHSTYEVERLIWQYGPDGSVVGEKHVTETIPIRFRDRRTTVHRDPTSKAAAVVSLDAH